MSIFDIILLAIALAMDCFAISIVTGVMMRRLVWRLILQMSILFGIFQALMPFIGWFGTNYFSEYLEAVDHWIAFGLLAFLGGRMIKESFEPEEEIHFTPDRFRTQLVLAIATSIDALAVGISFACVGYNSIYKLFPPLFIIGSISFIFGVAGNMLGVRFGRAIARRLHPEFVGGVILILIGVKILLSHINIFKL